MIKAVYPGTFDPITLGHQDLVRRAAALFDEIVVGIAASQTKNPFFTVEERVRLAREVLKPYGNVKVESFRGLLVDFVREQKAKVVLRGPAEELDRLHGHDAQRVLARLQPKAARIRTYRAYRPAARAPAQCLEQHPLALERGHRVTGSGELERDAAATRADVEDRPWMLSGELPPQRQVRAVGAALEVVPDDLAAARARQGVPGAVLRARARSPDHAQAHALSSSPRATKSSRSESIAV